MITRRGFIGGLAALVGGIAIDKAIPLGRVWSFPKTVKPIRYDYTIFGPCVPVIIGRTRCSLKMIFAGNFKTGVHKYDEAITRQA